MKVPFYLPVVLALSVLLVGCDDSSDSSSNGNGGSGSSSDANIDDASTDSDNPIAFDKSKGYLMEVDVLDDFERFYFENNPGVYRVYPHRMDIDGAEGMYKVDIRVQYYHEHNGRYQTVETYPAYQGYPDNDSPAAQFLVDEFTRTRLVFILDHDGDDEDVTADVAFRITGGEIGDTESIWTGTWSASANRERFCTPDSQSFSGGSPGLNIYVVDEDLFINRAWWPDAVMDGDNLTFDREFSVTLGSKRLEYTATGSGTADSDSFSFQLDWKRELFIDDTSDGYCEEEVTYSNGTRSES